MRHCDVPRGLVRLLLASAAVTGALALAGCNTDDVTPRRAGHAAAAGGAGGGDRKEEHAQGIADPGAHLQGRSRNSRSGNRTREGKFALLKTYPICRWSGELGPKVKEGDRQAPEGFYNITPGQMNPNSNYYLAFNLGFPNAYDRANDRTGAFLMVHGDCSSRGCYAMTDEQIQEIYALGRDSFIGGQKSFQVQAYPFRMTALNMARHRNSPNMAFWRMIKEGNDHFEVTRAEPQVDVCEKHYVFDARTPPNATPIAFRPRDRCPVYEISAEIAGPVKEKHDRDERAFTEYANRGDCDRCGAHGRRWRHASKFPRRIAPPGDGGRGRPAAAGRGLDHPAAPERQPAADAGPRHHVGDGDDRRRCAGLAVGAAEDGQVARYRRQRSGRSGAGGAAKTEGRPSYGRRNPVRCKAGRRIRPPGARIQAGREARNRSRPVACAAGRRRTGCKSRTDGRGCPSRACGVVRRPLGRGALTRCTRS